MIRPSHYRKNGLHRQIAGPAASSTLFAFGSILLLMSAFCKQADAAEGNPSAPKQTSSSEFPSSTTTYLKSKESGPLVQNLEGAGQTLLIEPDWINRLFTPDQRSEASLYDATRVIGLQQRSFSVRLVTRLETLNREGYAPALRPLDDTPTVDAVTLDWSASVSDVQNGERDERMILSLSRHDPTRPLKLLVSLLEPNIVLYKTFQFWKVPPLEIYHSTRPGEGDGERVIRGTFTSPDHPVPEEQLLFLVRCLSFSPGRSYNLRILSGQLTDRAESPQDFNAELSCARPTGDLVIPAGTFRPDDVREFDLLRSDGLRAVYFVGSDPPNRLLSWQTDDGRSLALRKKEPLLGEPNLPPPTQNPIP